jgi:hypothetical protein
MTDTEHDLTALLYDARVKLIDVKHDLETAAELDFATKDDELTPIIDLVDEALMRVKLVGHDGRWLT